MKQKVKRIEIRVGEKQLLVFERRLRQSEAEGIMRLISEWLKSDEPVLLICGEGVELIKVEK